MAIYQRKYDIIVVGAGHAGCEAALAAARMGCSVLLVAIDLDKLAAMPCSPSIGGMAKGQLVKEIDALGGEMARVTDQTAIQYRTLNTKKGPAVQSSRTQNDKIRYHMAMKASIEREPNIDLKQAMVERLVIEDGRVAGIEDATGFGYQACRVILATGTFLSGLVHIGFRSMQAGRAGEFASYGLPAHLQSLGFTLGRMKTGTPPRLRKSTIDFDCFNRQENEGTPVPFSFSTHNINLPQVPSYIGYTNLNSQRHAVAQTTGIYFFRIEPLGFQNDLMALPVRKPNNFIFKGRTVAGGYSLDDPAVKSGMLQIFPHDSMRIQICITDVAGHLQKINVMGRK